MNLLETLQQHPEGKFQPGREHLLATLERQGSASWEQWAPLRDGFATFAHTSAHIRKWIPGEAWILQYCSMRERSLGSLIEVTNGV
jgi:hypothetical protein